MMIKNGRIPNDEIEKILELAEKIPYTDIALQFNRNPETIKKLIEKRVGKKLLVGGKSNPAYDIKKSIVWKELKEQFSDEELEYFLYHWERTINQFKDDVFPTEEMQIVDMIKLDIFMMRIGKDLRKAIKEIDEIQQLIDIEKKLEIPDQSKISSLGHDITLIMAAKEAVNKEYTQYQQRKENMLKELKATRAERIKKIEESGKTVIGWITQLMQDSKLRKELGVRMEKMRIAVDLEKVRLMEPHSYIDKSEDCPLYSSDTIKYLKDKEEKE